MNRTPRSRRRRAMLFGALSLFLAGCDKVDLSTVKVAAQASELLMVDERAVWEVVVTNEGPAAVPVQDLDLSKSLLAGVTLDEASIDPPPQSVRSVVDYRSLRLDQVVQPGQSLTIRLPVVARAPEGQAAGDEITGDVDVCVDNFRQQSARIRYRVTTQVEELNTPSRPVDTPASASAYEPGTPASEPSGTPNAAASTPGREPATSPVAEPEPGPDPAEPATTPLSGAPLGAPPVPEPVASPAPVRADN